MHSETGQEKEKVGESKSKTAGSPKKAESINCRHTDSLCGLWSDLEL
jgi:hypothetical protein